MDVHALVSAHLEPTLARIVGQAAAILAILGALARQLAEATVLMVCLEIDTLVTTLGEPVRTQFFPDAVTTLAGLAALAGPAAMAAILDVGAQVYADLEAQRPLIGAGATACGIAFEAGRAFLFVRTLGRELAQAVHAQLGR